MTLFIFKLSRLQVKLRTAFGENDIIPESRIPFNHCQCPNVICSTTSTRPTTSTTPTKGTKCIKFI